MPLFATPEARFSARAGMQRPLDASLN